jgi:hypothetical protein
MDRWREDYAAASTLEVMAEVMGRLPAAQATNIMTTEDL